MTSIAVIIPARYGSTRFPGKPLEKLGDKTVLAHVVDAARAGVAHWPEAQIVVATDDDRIADHAKALGVDVAMTDPALRTGTDRVHAAWAQMMPHPDIVLNLQGDAPFTPPEAIEGVIKTLLETDAEVATPAVRVSWDDLDKLRAHKKAAPHSGTTLVVDKDKRALWFSKNVMPAMRDEEKLRAQSDMSPVLRHLGLYGYTAPALQSFVEWPEGTYEALEKLEQLRMLENGLTVRAVILDRVSEWALGGIDTPEDLARANAHLKDKA